MMLNYAYMFMYLNIIL